MEKAQSCKDNKVQKCKSNLYFLKITKHCT